MELIHFVFEDFKQDEVEVIVDPLGSLVIKGARKSGENEHVRFERHFKLPEDSDMTKTVTRKLQNDMLYITVCRKSVKEDKWEFESAPKEETRGEEQDENKDVEGEKETIHETKAESVDDKKKELGKPKTILEKIEHHKCILFGILAFAFGVFVASHKLRRPPPR